MHEISAIRLITDIVIYISSLSLILATYILVRPFHAPSIACSSLAAYSHKMLASTVSDKMLAAQCFLLPLFVIVISESVFQCVFKTRHRHKINMFNKLSIGVHPIIAHTYKYLGAYLAGLSCVTLLTVLAKGTVGRMRPYFLTLCDPVFNLHNHSSVTDLCTARPLLYMYTDFECRSNDKAALLEAQFSFPSGHASQGFYAMVFLCLYLGARWKRYASYLTLFIQTVFVGNAAFTALTRIADSKHFYSDVGVGILVGIAMAFGAFYQLLGKPAVWSGEKKEQASKQYSLLSVNACSRSSSHESANKELV